MIHLSLTANRVRLSVDDEDSEYLSLVQIHHLIERLQDAAKELTVKLNHNVVRDEWVPASGGLETPFKTRSGKTLLYCWNSKQERHAFLDVGSDIILTDEEANAALGYKV